jgi:hypothetical protein
MSKKAKPSDQVVIEFKGLRIKHYNFTPTNDGRGAHDVYMDQYGRIMKRIERTQGRKKINDWESTGVCGCANH